MSWLIKLSRLASSQTARQTYLVSSGNLVSSLFGFISIIIISRALGPTSFGIFSLATSLLVICGDIFDLGINSGIIKFAAEAFGQGKVQNAYRYLKASLTFKISAGLIIAVVGWFLSPALASLAFHDSSLTGYLRLSLLGVIGILLFSFSTSFLQSQQAYIRLTIVNLVSGFGKVLGVGLLLVMMHQGSFGALTIYVVTPFLAFIVSLFFIGTGFASAKPQRSHWLDIFHFSKWTALLVLFATLHARIDVLMLSSLTTKQEVGFYSAASRLTFIFPIIASSFGSVVIPKVVNFQGPHELNNFLKKSLAFITANALLIAILIALSSPAISLIYGPSYTQSTVIFQVLLLGMLAFITTSPFTATFYKLNTPQFFAAVSFVELLATILLDLLLIPRLHGLGAAVSFSAVNLLGLIVTIIFVWWRTKHAKI